MFLLVIVPIRKRNVFYRCYKIYSLQLKNSVHSLYVLENEIDIYLKFSKARKIFFLFF